MLGVLLPIYHVVHYLLINAQIQNPSIGEQYHFREGLTLVLIGSLLQLGIMLGAQGLRLPDWRSRASAG